MDCPKCCEPVDVSKTECPKCGVIYVKAFMKQSESQKKINEVKDSESRIPSNIKENVVYKYIMQQFKIITPIILITVVTTIFFSKYFFFSKSDQNNALITEKNLAVSNSNIATISNDTKNNVEISLTGDSFIKGNVVWLYNDYVGLKADVNTVVRLFRRTSEKAIYLEPLDASHPRTNKEKGIYYTTVNMQGAYNISNLPEGTAAPGPALKLTENWPSHRWSQIDKQSHQYNAA
jgi:hypothetical protein